MSQVFKQLFADFFAALVFLAIYFATGNIYAATGFAMLGSLGQFALARYQGRTLDVMSWAILALVIVLGGATILTRDPRFVMVKPSIVHFAIAGVMLRRGWMLRYLPLFVKENISASVIIASGYCWAALMVALGLINIAIAASGDLVLWGWWISVGAMGAKVAAFGLQYVLFRAMIYRRIRAAMSSA
jgi:intracellular septation protein